MINYINWHRLDYAEALSRQTQLFDTKVAQKLKGETSVGQDFIVCEHNNVYTLGMHGNEKNFLMNEEFLKKIDAHLYRTNRGGDITYHGPGQITGYPILDIDALKIGIKEYINTIEQMIIDVMDTYNIKCGRLQGATGVWIDAYTPKARKICAIGVKASRGITMHGFAMNVNTDLNYFNYINPCGFTDKGVTSMAKELNETMSWDIVAKQLYERFVFLTK